MREDRKTREAKGQKRPEEQRKWKSLRRRQPPGLRGSRAAGIQVRGTGRLRNPKANGETMGAERPGASGDVQERATREHGPGDRRAGGCTGRGGSAARSWAEASRSGRRGFAAPRRPGGRAGVPQAPGRGVAYPGTEAVKAGVMAAKKHTPRSGTGPAAPDEAQARQGRHKGVVVNCVELLMLEMKPEYEDTLN
ncbi:uncharacterized protein [Vulpes vulpes]|uniref:Uncharacterized protein isoform X2 n=1 Tax=Vulpes vulpes TaxID=9627 RepID=A0ABM4XW21_VULVU|nr:uncharacterized protein LOC112932324 [Vulpes vulpes]